MERKFEEISEEYANELRNFVTDLLMIDYATFEKNKKAFPGYGKKIMDFFRLEKTPLHKQYLERCRPCKELSEKQATDELIKQMSIKKNRFTEDNNISEEEVKYYIIKRFTTQYKFGEIEEWLTIGIPYYATVSKKYRFGGTVNISKKKTPKIFDDVIHNFRRFNQNEDVYISLDK